MCALRAAAPFALPTFCITPIGVLQPRCLVVRCRASREAVDHYDGTLRGHTADSTVAGEGFADRTWFAEVSVAERLNGDGGRSP